MDDQGILKIWILNGNGRLLPDSLAQLKEYEFLPLTGEDRYPEEIPSAVIVLVEQAGDLELSEGFVSSPLGRNIPLVLMLSDEMENTLDILPSHQGVLSFHTSPLLLRDTLRTVLAVGSDAVSSSGTSSKVLSDEVYASTLENSPIGIIVHAADTSVIYNNPAAEKIMGLTKQQLMGKKVRNPHWKFVDEEQQILSPEEYPVSLVMASGKSMEHKIFGIIRPDRNFITWVMVNAIPVLNKDGGLDRVIVNLYDITEYKILQNELSHRNKMDAIGLLAGGIAHDFNNMLTGIMSSVELLKTRVDRESMDNTYLDIILQSSQRAADLNSKLLSFARKGRGASLSINIHSLLNSLVQRVSERKDKRIRIITSKKARHHTVKGDEVQLGNAFQNLCLNAIQAMPYGGELSLVTENVHLDEIYCRYSPFQLDPGHYLSIEFKDQGEGIPPENQKKIFDPFFTTRPTGKGTGLGLASVYGTVEQHNGAVTVYSEVGVGSSFHVYLPLSSDQVLLQHGEDEAVKGVGTILLVDDEEFIRITAKGMLEALDYKVLVAENGQDALDLFKATEENIDLVILDMVMPVMDGMQTFRELKILSPETRILLSSGFTRSEDLERLHEMGLAGYVKKPYRLLELSRALAEALK